jgi:leucyl aminopeptidase
MLATATLALPADTQCDTVAVGLFEGKGIPHDIDGAMQALVDSGEARPSYRHLAVTHAAGKRLIVVGLGNRDALTPERLRVAAASVQERARDLGARRLCWELPHKVGAGHAAALVEGTSLSAYRFDRYKSPSAEERPRLQELVVAAHDDHAETVRRALLVSEAVNRARDLQNTPANDLTPMRLGATTRPPSSRCATTRRTRSARSSGSSARPSPSTRAASRSSRRRGWRT